MARPKKSEPPPKRRRPPPSSPEEQEARMINAAMDLAERQFEDGSASPSVIVHYLKLGSSREKLEQDIMAEQRKLVVAKTSNIESQAKMETMYEDAIKAMRRYQGQRDD